MKKINILYDATCVCNALEKSYLRSGLFFVAYNVLLEFLKRDDFNVYLYSEDIMKLERVIKNDEGLKKARIFNISNFDKLISSLKEFKSENKKTNKNKFLRFFATLFISALKRLKNLYYRYFLRLDDIDAYFSPVYAIPDFIAAKNSIKKYAILHDTIPLVDGYLKKDKNNWFYKLVKSLNSKDKYFANSLYTKMDFLEYVPVIRPDNISVIPLSTGMPYFKLGNECYINQIKRKYGIPDNKKYIFSLCNLNPRKNLIFSIRNFLKFIEKNNLDDFIFVLGGSHFKEFEQILTNSIKSSGVKKDKILRIGYVDDEDLSALYSGAEMFVFPSLYEGFGMPVLEAMKCALPVICSNTTSLPEVIGECGIQINPNSDEEMVQAMEKMYFDREFREECIKRGLERAKMFTWKNCIDVISAQIKKDFKYEENSINNNVNV